MASTRPLNIFMLAGEASGDAMGGDILNALKEDGRALHITGVGGSRMIAQGLKPIFPMEELTVFGFLQAMKAYKRLKQRGDELVRHIISSKPDVVVTIDCKGFSLQLGKMLKKAMASEGWSAPIIHLVAPTVWAWGSWRAKSVGASVDRLLCLFPFEVPYFTPHGVDAVAVGHPSADIKRPSRSSARQELKLNHDEKVIGLFPGSRRREIETLLPLMITASSALHKADPSLKFILPSADTVSGAIAEMTAGHQHIQLVPQAKAGAVMAASDYGLICSGTVTLETALSGLHGHIYYKADFLTTMIAKLVFDISKLVLANAVTGEEVYQFSVNKDATSDHMVNAVTSYFSRDLSDQREDNDIKTRLAKSMAAGDHTFGQNTANAIKDMLNDR